MKTIVNRFVPMNGYTALTVWPLLFIRRDEMGKFSSTTLRHEKIHARQQVEVLLAVLAAALAAALLTSSPWCLLPAPFVYYLWYLTEWLIRLALYRDRKEAYRNISFEQEAYLRESSSDYLAHRRRFAWLHFIHQKTWRRRRLSQN